MEDTEAKIAEYQRFIEHRLKPDLAHVLQALESVNQQRDSYLKLRETINQIKREKKKQMKTLVNLGAHFYAQAQVTDVSRIFVTVGLGFHVEFTLDEALEFIKVKETDLGRRIETLNERANSIKERIMLMYDGIAGLRSLAQDKPS
jgi:prefoldin alpha subunit